MIVRTVPNSIKIFNFRTKIRKSQTYCLDLFSFLCFFFCMKVCSSFRKIICLRKPNLIGPKLKISNFYNFVFFYGSYQFFSMARHNGRNNILRINHIFKLAVHLLPSNALISKTDELRLKS